MQVERDEQNRQLRENYDQLKKLEELRDNLTHMVIHDMRSPLMGITGGLEILEDAVENKLNPDELTLIKNAQSSGRVLVGMVNSLLDISRLEQGKMPLQVTDVDVDVWIQQALTSLGSLTRQVSLQYQKASLPVMVNGDADLVTRVIANWVGNAIKFTPESGTVAISADTNDGGIRGCIADTGRGIPREYHAKIFEKFGQVETRQPQKQHSTGLGLTFCKLAVEAHGGTIGVDSSVGHGSTFWFTRPPLNRSINAKPRTRDGDNTP